VAIARQRIQLPPRAWSGAVSCLARRRLWDGPDIERFERTFADFVGMPEALAVPSGRAGLRFIFEALDLEPGAEILFSAFAYPVVPHLARSLGFHVRFVDCEMETLGMDPEALARAISPNTRAIVATHLYGVPCRIRQIAALAESHGATLIEDCAHCFGASVGGRKAGAWGSFGYFSFETSKPINTMGGGMVTVRDPQVAARMRKIAAAQPSNGIDWLLKRLGKTTFETLVTHPLVFNLGVYPALRLTAGTEKSGPRFASGYQRDEVTMQGRMGRYTNYQARLGLAQIERLRPVVERRVANALRLIEALSGRVHFQTHERPDVTSNFMLVTALFPDMPAVAHELLRLGVDTKHHYMRDCSGLADTSDSFPLAARAEREVLHLPAHPELDGAAVDRIAEKIAHAVDAVAARAPVDAHAQ